MAVVCTEPLGAPLPYDARFKVDTYMHEPHWGSTVSLGDIHTDIMALCAQIDLLCKKELAQRSSGRIEGKVSNQFESKSMVLLKKLEESYEKLPQAARVDLDDYMDVIGLSKLFPRAAAFVVRPNNLQLAYKKTLMDGYFPHLGLLHQLVTLAHQINSDITNLRNHKYIPHQIAILFQTLNSIDSRLLGEFVSSVEQNFKEVKARIMNSGMEEPYLLPEQKNWVLELTSGIVQTVERFPAELTKEMFSLAQTLQDYS